MTGLLIIDGYNAIHALPLLRSRLDQSLESARDGLMKAAREWRAGRAAWEVLVVYDGQSAHAGQGSRSGTNVRCIFTSSRVEADDTIKDLIRKRGSKAQTIVVTRDREILNCCRDHGVRAESPDFLLQKKSSSSSSGAPGASDDISAKDKKSISDWYRDALKAKGKL